MLAASAASFFEFPWELSFSPSSEVSEPVSELFAVEASSDGNVDSLVESSDGMESPSPDVSSADEASIAESSEEAESPVDAESADDESSELAEDAAEDDEPEELSSSSVLCLTRSGKV